MAVRGNKPQPRSIHVVRGTDRADRHGPDLPASGRVGEPPGFLPADARDYWTELVGVLEDLGVVARADQDAVEHMVMLWWRKRAAAREIVERGGVTYIDAKGNEKRHPSAIEYDATGKELRMCWNEYGMTPSARARLGGSDDGLSARDKKRFGLG